MKKPVVVKIGGSIFNNRDTVLEDLVALQERGEIPIVVHGGGNKVTEWLSQMGIATSSIEGLRVTDERTLDVVVAVLGGLVNKELVGAIVALGGKAIGLSGIDGRMIQGKFKSLKMGYAGEVEKVATEPIEMVLDKGYIPVIAPMGIKIPTESDETPSLLNINGDATATAIARAFKADSLIFLTDVPGVLDTSGRPMTELTFSEGESLLSSGVISGGMVPKMQNCLKSLDSVSFTLIIDGHTPHALLDAINGEVQGTRIVKS